MSRHQHRFAGAGYRAGLRRAAARADRRNLRAGIFRQNHVCLHVIANAQKAGGTCAIIDAEHAIDPTYAKNRGRCGQFAGHPSETGEDALNIVDTLVRSNAVDVLVIDSVAALVPRAEIDGSMEDSHMGLQARLMSQALQADRRGQPEPDSALFSPTDSRKDRRMFGNPETTTGGNALKFYASIRMDIRKIGAIKDPAGEIIGNRTRVKVIKNKMAPPFKVAEFDINYAEGISRSGSILDVAVDMGILEKRGSWFSLDGEQLGQGREQTKALIAGNPEVEEKLLAKIKAKLSSGEVKLEGKTEE